MTVSQSISSSAMSKDGYVFDFTSASGLIWMHHRLDARVRIEIDRLGTVRTEDGEYIKNPAINEPAD